MSVRAARAVAAVALLACLPAVMSYYVPGTYPAEFSEGDELQGVQQRAVGAA